MKKKLLSILTLSLMLVSLFCISVSAASFPSLSASAYCEFKASKQINVYKDTALKTRGTSSPSKKYNASISKNDVCYIYKITSSYIQVNYPTSSGRKTGYIKRSDLIGVASPTEQVTSNGKATTYVSAGGTSYGNTAKNDKVFACGTSGGYTAVIYTAKSGKRAYKFGWVTTNDYNSIIKVGGNVSVPENSNSGSYSPRTTAPAKNNPYYYSSKNIFYQSGYGMPNCTAYAYGRAYEILGSKPNLCTRSAGAWYNYNKSNNYYSYGSTPKVGAIACWSKNGTSTGHVAVVEKVNSNGTVLISESHYKGTNFNTRTIKNNSSDYLRSYTFMGYIYIR